MWDQWDGTFLVCMYVYVHVVCDACDLQWFLCRFSDQRDGGGALVCTCVVHGTRVWFVMRVILQWSSCFSEANRGMLLFLRCMYVYGTCV